ncbi:glycoside hydrolase family 26 protein [Actinoplanes utahensis]|uniref:glycoside hydrolase family 26 protein n=1 Tax=Actinoplanes utahensis TaxID=1869 RepID=UPI00068FEC07|nr:glycosyl hydrolase [Actinoplanes utahensis]GIF27436.1 hypothetical protein Aut01nite_04220 [Actinoplanes utahensis]
MSDAGISRRGLLGLAGLGGAAAAGAFGVWKAAVQEPSVPVEAVDPVEPTPPPAPSGTPAPFADATGDLGGTVPFVAGKAMLGSYLDLSEMSYPEAVRLRRRQLGRDQRITHVFYAWPDTLPSSIKGMPEDSIPMVSWRGPKYRKILDGGSDELIARAARRLKAWNRPVFLRWGWEMNGFWYDWGGSRNDRKPDGYVTCFRRLRRIFDAEGADNISWVWSPNWNNQPNEPWNRLVDYYPGDEYVDWVGVSGYNVGKERVARLFDPIYGRYASRKPLMISEVGSKDHGGSTKADWIGEFHAYVEQRPAIGAVVWFDTDTHPHYPEKWRFDTSKESTAAFTAMARSARLSG